MNAHPSSSPNPAAHPSYTIGVGSAWDKMWHVPAALAGLGLVGSIVGYATNPDRFAFSYLFSFFAVLTLVLGGMFLAVVQHLMSASWGVSSRRVVEVIGSAAPLMAVLFLPLAIGVGTGTFSLYDEWMSVAHHGAPGAHAEHGEGSSQESDSEGLLGEGVAKAQGHGDAAASEEVHSGHTPQEEQLHHAVLEHKSSYLNTSGWLWRALVYFAIWIAIGLFYFRTSTRQDQSRDPRLSVSMARLAPLALIAFGLSLTFAAFDWLMSLEPAWYSTIFGVVVFAGSAVGIFALTILICLSLYKHGLLGHAVNVEHFHDLGKLLFGFVCFWAYVSFSQWMLIWYAGIPEEATWYHRRWAHGWQFWSLLLMIGHFAVPFYFLISRVVKRNLDSLRWGATWVLVMHMADVYWLVLPQAGHDARLDLNYMDVSSLLFVGGIFFTFVCLMLRRQPLVPIGDPRLQRSLGFHQVH